MIKEILNDYGSRMTRAFSHDRSKTVGASEIGLCARRISFTKRGFLTDSQEALVSQVQAQDSKKRKPQKLKAKSLQKRDMRGAAQVPANWGAHVRGTTIEEQLWIPAMQARFGKDLIRCGEEQETLSSGDLSATPDGIVLSRGHELLQSIGAAFDPKKTSKCVVVECKSIDPRVNLVEEKKENVFQVQVQMGLIRELTPYKPDWAVISYVDASFWHDVAEFAVPFRQADFDAAKMRAAKMLRADPQDLRPEGWISGGKECGWCPWARRCAQMRGGVPESEAPVDEQFKAEIVDLCRQANAIKVKTDESMAAYRDLQDQIKERLRARGVRKLPGVVNWYNVKGRESYDVDAMVRALEERKVDVDQFRATGEPTNQLSIDKKVALL